MTAYGLHYTCQITTIFSRKKLKNDVFYQCKVKTVLHSLDKIKTINNVLSFKLLAPEEVIEECKK